MEQILPALEGQLRRFRRNSAALAGLHPGLARHLGPTDATPDPHVDRLVQGVAMLHARSALALDRARTQQDEHLLEWLYPQQLRPFPACRIGPALPGRAPAATILAARFLPAPEATIELEIEAHTACSHVDIFLDGDSAFSAALRTALLAGSQPTPQHRAAARPGAKRAGDGEGGWIELGACPFEPCGLDPEQALLPRPAGAHAGLALLREFFMFPARFNMVRLDLRPFGGAGKWTLRLPLEAKTASDPAARLLEALNASHLRASQTANACLERIAAAPIQLDGSQAEYILSIPPDREIFSIDRVVVTHAGSTPDCHWTARHVPGAPPGHEWRIAFAATATATASAHPCAVASIEVTSCRRAKVLARPARGAGSRWQLLTLLALEQLPASAPALRALMKTQAINNSQSSQAMIAAVRDLNAHPVLLQSGRAAPIQGTELRLRIDEAPFAGCGLLLFAQVMDRFFGECAHINTFTRLVLVNASTGEELIRCKARNAGTVLE